jgi:glycosyltransferase involved in cell wall biosynthesis
MQTLEAVQMRPETAAGAIPVSVIVPVRNEAHNLARCLEALRDFGEVVVVDSQSTDSTCQIAYQYGARVVQFHYQGGWPKKRQWAMDTVPLVHDWVLLIDADEVMTPQLAAEIRSTMQNPQADGYYIRLRIHFLGRELRFCNASFWKLSFFRRGQGRYECRLKDQDRSMADMEVHEHVVVRGSTGRLKNFLVHRNVESLARYIQKHNEYSNWEARVFLNQEASENDLPADLFGTQAQRRRWFKKKCLGIPGSPVLFFLYKYIFSLGFLDGIPGLIYCGFQAVQFFHIKAKIYELQVAKEKAAQG